MTLSYHSLAIEFQEEVEDGQYVPHIHLQYPTDYARIAYLAGLASKDEDRFRKLFLRPLLTFYREKLGIEEAQLSIDRP
jgi:hypothetical protein